MSRTLVLVDLMENFTDATPNAGGGAEVLVQIRVADVGGPRPYSRSLPSGQATVLVLQRFRPYCASKFAAKIVSLTYTSMLAACASLGAVPVTVTVVSVA